MFDETKGICTFQTDSWYVFIYGASLVAWGLKNPPANAGDLGSIPGLERFPWRREWQPTPGFLPGASHGWRSLVGYSPRGHKESDTTEQLDSLTQDMTIGRPRGAGEQLVGDVSALPLKGSACVNPRKQDRTAPSQSLIMS